MRSRQLLDSAFLLRGDRANRCTTAPPTTVKCDGFVLMFAGNRAADTQLKMINNARVQYQYCHHLEENEQLTDVPVIVFSDVYATQVRRENNVSDGFGSDNKGKKQPFLCSYWFSLISSTLLPGISPPPRLTGTCAVCVF